MLLKQQSITARHAGNRARVHVERCQHPDEPNRQSDRQIDCDTLQTQDISNPISTYFRPEHDQRASDGFIEDDHLPKAIQMGKVSQTTHLTRDAGINFTGIANAFFHYFSVTCDAFNAEYMMSWIAITNLSQRGLATGTDAGYSQRATCQLRSVSACSWHVKHK